MRKHARLVILFSLGGSLFSGQAHAQNVVGQRMPTVQALPIVQALPTVQAEEIHGGGNWAAATGAEVATVVQQWNMDGLHFSDNTISGRISISGSSLFDAANVEGQLSGQGVTGKLVDDEGKEFAVFEGAVTSNGAAGTYRDRTGEVGQWQWQGQPRTQLSPSQP